MRKNILVKALLGVVIMVTLVAGWQPAKAEGNVVNMAFPFYIMPFGDSITTSKDNYSSYRCYLDHSLHAAGIPFIYAGTQDTNWSGNNPLCGNPLTSYDVHHEGHSGAMAWDFLHPNNWGAPYIYTLDNILGQKIPGKNTPIPDMVLMHLGTNDLIKGHSTDQIKSDLEALIDVFRNYNPKVIILVAQIIPCNIAPYIAQCNNIPALNAVIPSIATDKNTADSPVLIVDQYTGFSVSGDLFDGIHPNSSGDQKIAARWMATIQNWWNTAFKKTYIPTIIN